MEALPPAYAPPGETVLVERVIRASYDQQSIRVYQAYPPEIAEAAVRAGTFVAPFKMDRMTWIKPSFLWMMYRSGWAGKDGQERVLAVDITREGFEWALAHSCLSAHDAQPGTDMRAWRERLSASPVRIQWDPDRDVRLNPLARRAIQIGLTGEAVTKYVQEWIVNISDCTAFAKEIRALAEHDAAAAERKLPPERPYPVSAGLRETIAATG